MIIKLYYFKFSSEIRMLPLSIPFPQSMNILGAIQYPPVFSTPVLNLPKDTYEDYLAFLFENNDELSSDNHTVYLQKAAFDSVLENFHDEELSILQEKEDMYMYYIMYSTFFNAGKLSQQEFLHNVTELFQFYSLTQDEILFVQQLQEIVKNTLVHQISPFTYLQACKEFFSEKLQLKLIDILKFMIGDSFCYKLNPASIFGICLKWTIDKYGINNSMINELISRLIDLNCPQISQKIGKLTQLMNQIMNMNPSQ